MKKILLSVLLVPILLVACGAPPVCVCQCECPQATSEAVSGTLEPQAPRSSIPQGGWTYEDMVVGFVQIGSESGWRTANTISFKETAMELGITLKFYDSAGVISSGQERAFREFLVDEDVNVIVLDAFEPTGWEDMLREARAAGKIVILEDRRIDAPDDLYATYIGSDFLEEGRKAGAEMCKLLEGMPEKNIWELAGSVGSSAARERGQGFHEKVGECGIQVIRSQTANWNIREGKAVTEAWLKEPQDIQGIFAQNDDMALGVIEALKEAGLKPGLEVKIVSVDGTSGAFKAMLAGELNVSVECNPLLAPQVYEAALKALNGKSLPKWIPAKEGVFRADDPNLQKIADSRKY